MPLRDYQSTLVDGARSVLREHRSCLIQLATGAGKTPVVAEITRTAFSRDFRVWFVVPRNELLQQGSEHFQKWGVPHGLIAAGHEESRAYRVHVVSKDTLLRRLDRIKNWPDLLIFDEAHLYYDAQLKLVGRSGELERLRERGEFLPLEMTDDERASWYGVAPQTTRILGLTATPERLDGRGLSDIYGDIVYGPSIPELVERGYLARLRYFAPPAPEGLSKLHMRGTEVAEDEYEEFLASHKQVIFGDLIRHYGKYGKRENPRPGQNTNKPALIFTRSVKAAREISQALNDAGYRFLPIWGNMPDAERKFAFRAIREERIDGLVNCDLATYGVDIPNLEYAASTRFTLSRSLYFQMIGRLLRVTKGKTDAVFVDHANLLREHQDRNNPGVPLVYLRDLAWNFTGREVRHRDKQEGPTVRLCPARDFLYCDDPRCASSCRLDPNAAPKSRDPLQTVDVELVERTQKAPLRDYPPEEKQAMHKRIQAALQAYVDAAGDDETHVEPGPVGDLLAIADELGRSPMWVYWYLWPRKNAMVNVPLLHEIARQKGYKAGWVWFKRKQIQQGIEEGREQEASA